MVMEKNKSKTHNFYELDELTLDRLKDMARFLERTENDIIKLLVNQYYKHQVIEHEDEDGYLSMEFIPLFETRETYQQLKDDYFKEYGFEYPAKIINKENYNDYFSPSL